MFWRAPDLLWSYRRPLGEWPQKRPCGKLLPRCRPEFTDHPHPGGCRCSWRLDAAGCGRREGRRPKLPISGHNAWLLAIFRVPDLRGRACARGPLAKSSRVVNEGEAAGLRYLAPVVYDGTFARTTGSARVQVAVSSHPDER